MATPFDFSGWATKNDLLCADGKIIRRGAFADNDGDIVPLVWQHCHNSPSNIIGHALLQNQPEGMYTYGVFNDTENGQHAKALVKHGDITALSIYANQIKQQGGNVVHGNIREVSLVIAGANPGASIEHIMVHGDEDGESVIIHNDDYTVDTETLYEMYNIDEEEDLSHADNNRKDNSDMDMEKSIKQVFEEMTEEQKACVYFFVGEAMGANDDVEHYDMEGDYMKANIFDKGGDYGDTLAHAAMRLYEDKDAIFADAKRLGSFKDAILSHAADYGIENVDYLFPDPKNVANEPELIKREDEWVTKVMERVSHSPFSRIKSILADITADEARAKGYIKGKRKQEEVFTLLKRSTSPTTIYKKQKIDRDDILDITDFDVIGLIKLEMRGLLNEEIARAILIGDGRSTASDDKIDETNVRPVLTDDSLFSIKVPVSVAADADGETVAKAIIRQLVKCRKLYKGSGNPDFYTSDDWLTDMLLLEDGVGRKIYHTVNELATAIRVKEIVTVPVMEGLKRELGDNEYGVKGEKKDVIGILVNLKDYRVGKDRNGQVSMFDDFDIDYNQQKYLMETRMSGALTKPFSAIVLELNRVASSNIPSGTNQS